MNQALSINKTAETIALILQLHQKPMILSKLLKIMYFIDRLYLSLANRSLTNDDYECQPSGLIPRNIPELVMQLQFIEILMPVNTDLEYINLNRNSKAGSLSNLEKEIITEVYFQKKDVAPFDLIAWDYDLWFIRNHLKQRQNNILKPTDIMLSLGKTKAEILDYCNHQILVRSGSDQAENYNSVSVLPPKTA